MKGFSLRSKVENLPTAADVKALKPLSIIGGLYAMTLDMFVAMFKPPFQWREFLLQTWFVARVSMVPALTLSIPLVVLTSFTFNTLLGEFGAADFSGTGAALGAVNQIGPFVTVLVVAGAGAGAAATNLSHRQGVSRRLRLRKQEPCHRHGVRRPNHHCGQRRADRDRLRSPGQPRQGRIPLVDIGFRAEMSTIQTSGSAGGPRVRR